MIPSVSPLLVPRPALAEVVSAGVRRASRLAARLLRCEAGASHIEYALIAGFAGTLLLGAYIRLADSLDGFFRALSGMLDDVL